MSLKQRTYSVLVVSAAERVQDSLLELLSGTRYGPVCRVCGVSAAKRMLAERAFDFIIVNAPLADGNGVHFAMDAGNANHGVVLLLVRSDIYCETADRAAAHGVFVLSKPAARSVVIHALAWMASARERIRLQENRTQSLEEKMAEIRAINRAKLLLISRAHMDEAQAHRCIEKQAMDRCVTRKRIAEEIIETLA